MRFVHRLTIGSDNTGLLESLAAIGLREESPVSRHLAFIDIAEHDARWNDVEKLIHTRERSVYFSDLVWTEFTQEE